MRVAVIGAGISGLACAYALNTRHEVRLIEANARLGGHAHTQNLVVKNHEISVDTGFIVYNDRNYPDLIKLLSELQIDTIESDMSFAASVDDGSLEYCGSSPTALFAQPSNLINPRFLRMLRDVLKFNKIGTKLIEQNAQSDLTLGQFLNSNGLGSYFQNNYLLPMGAAIWSMPVRDMLAFPAATFLRFFHNHGLLTVNDHPQWRTLSHRSQDYVGRIADHLKQMPILGDPAKRVFRDGEQLIVCLQSGWSERFDHVVLASHADQSLNMLDGEFAKQRDYLANFRFQSNDAILHSDPKLMPRRKRAWASWNYLTSNHGAGDPRVSLTYWMNKLQSIDAQYPLFVTLNPSVQPDPELVHNRMSYDHPIFDQRAVAAQGRLDEVQGHDGLWLAGAWLGYGFHEDGARSGLDIAAALGSPCSWQNSRPARNWLQPTALAA